MSVPYILGVDLSSRRVDVAAVPLHEPPTLRQTIHFTHHAISTTDKQAAAWAKEPAARCVALGQAARTCLHVLHARNLDIVAVVIERPAGHAAQHLLPIFGAVTAALDEYPPVWLNASAIRAALGCGRAKEAAYQHVAQLVNAGEDDLDEHQADALAAALAHRVRLIEIEEAA